MRPHLSGESGGQNGPINGPIKCIILKTLQLIQTNPGIKKATIAQQIGKSETTVKRYAKMLADGVFPSSATNHKSHLPKGACLYYLARQWSMNLNTPSYESVAKINLCSSSSQVGSYPSGINGSSISLSSGLSFVTPLRESSIWNE